jgi:NAD(P)-dependent dehydrogenase (short-subunit alcohol dehydrogenase family)
MAVAIITGGSKGFGRALARDLARDGWDLVVDARRADELEAAANELRTFGTTVHAIPGDVTDAAHRERLVEAAHSLGRLDLLVNNASTLGPTPLPALRNYPIDELEQVYRVNVIAPLALVQRALPLLHAANGTVVGITSDAAVEDYEGWGGYGSSKAALEQLHHVLAAEQPDLHVYWFDPGDMRTEMHQDAFPGEDISDRPEPETAVPALRRLIFDRPASGRYRAAELATGVTS